jgi:hypothetical protein
MDSIKITSWTGENQTVFEKMLESDNLTFFDPNHLDLATDFKNKHAGRVSHFKFDPKGGALDSTNGFSRPSLTYEKNEEIARLSGNITFLSGRSLRSLLVKYPYRSKYVVYRTNIDANLAIAWPGLARRIRLGAKRNNAQIIYKGKIETSFAGKKETWAIIENRNARVPTHFSLDERVGAGGFISFLNDNKICYVILRFFEKLPEKYREGGDIDMLVADEDLPKVSAFLEANPGGEMVDMYGVSTPASTSMLPYHPPYLSRKILENKRIGPGSASVPSDIDYLNSFIYHCLYHKGLSSGIPTSFKNLKPSSTPDNNYALKIEELAHEIGLKLDITLEGLDNYMIECGWRPHIDTLEFIAPNNEWVENLLKSLKEKDEIGLNVCIIKKGAISDNIFEEIVTEFESHDLTIIRSEILSDEQAQTAFNHLRGGNWTSTGNDIFHPGAAIVLADTKDLVLHARHKGMTINRIRDVKIALRRKLDTEKESYIHVTDNTTQALEYLNVLFPNQIEELLKEVNIITSNKPKGIDIKSHTKLHKIRLTAQLKVLSKKFKAIIARSLG